MAKPIQNLTYWRNPIYIVYALAAILLFLLCAVIAAHDHVGPLEKSIFDLFYLLPAGLAPLLRFISLFGMISFAIGLCLICLILRRRDIAIRLFASSITAYVIANWLKNWIDRPRPAELLSVMPRDQVSSFSFPSSHAAVAAAIGLTLALYLPRVWRKWALLGIVLVCVSRVYLGVHYPLDVVGGYSVGLFCYSLVELALGSIHLPVDVQDLISKMTAAGLGGLTLKPAVVDARGSVPFFGKYDNGDLFVKVYNQDNNTADWLFKLSRRLIYRRPEDEVPYLTPKRALEHEAYLTILAKYQAKVRAPEIVGVYHVSLNSYAMATKRLSATGLDKIEADKITDDMLVGIWRQILDLHSSRIIHRDLRCANVMIEDATGLPWIIDFGFAESAIEPHAFHKDSVEFIASSATRVGAKRAVSQARAALGQTRIEQAIPYMQYAALSGATTKAVKQSNLLHELQSEMYQAAGDRPKSIKAKKISRISRTRI